MVDWAQVTSLTKIFNSFFCSLFYTIVIGTIDCGSNLTLWSVEDVTVYWANSGSWATEGPQQNVVGSMLCQHNRLSATEWVQPNAVNCWWCDSILGGILTVYWANSDSWVTEGPQQRVVGSMLRQCPWSGSNLTLNCSWCDRKSTADSHQFLGHLESDSSKRLLTCSVGVQQ